MTPPLVIRAPFYVVVVCIALLLVGVLLAASQPVMFLVLVPMAAMMALWMRSYLVADDEGLTFRSYGLRTRHLPWAEVAGLAYLSSVRFAGTQVLRTDGGRQWLPWVDNYERGCRSAAAIVARAAEAGWEVPLHGARRDGSPVR